MRVSPVTGSLIVAAAACGWFVRGVGSPVAEVVQTQPVRAVVGHVATTAPPPIRVISDVPVTGGTGSGRNIFAYREDPQRVQHVSPPVMERAHSLPAMVPAAPQPVMHAPPSFGYRFIGTFGPAGDRLAAFSRDGEIVTARPGDRIGGTFVVKSIGIESVEVESAAGPQRVPLGGA